MQSIIMRKAVASLCSVFLVSLLFVVVQEARRRDLFSSSNDQHRALSSSNLDPEVTYPDGLPKTNLRGLFFGTSRTWGTGLEKQLHNIYPRQVTTNATNLAMRGTGPVSQRDRLKFDSRLTILLLACLILQRSTYYSNIQQCALDL